VVIDWFRRPAEAPAALRVEQLGVESFLAG
jgi:hypothetical protein